MQFWQCSKSSIYRIFGVLLVHIGLKIHNVTIQVVSIMEVIFFIISNVMSIDIPLSSASPSFWCILGIIV